MQNISDFADDVVRNITSGTGNGGGEAKPTLPEGWEKDKVDKVESEDGIDVPVPKGFVASKATGEKKVNDGFVIYQGTEDVTDENVEEARTSRNQFVWIPVEDPSEMFGTDKDGNSLGKLYDFGTKDSPKNPPTALNWTEDSNEIMKWTSATKWREPDVVTDSGYDNTASNYAAAGIEGITNATQFKEQLQGEFELMRASIEKYHGFYIGRYETGDLSQTKANTVKGNADISNQNWYYLYRKNKSIAEGTGITSSMIWGCQWDAIMKWFLKDSSTAGYVRNAEDKGNWSGTKALTGSNNNYNVKNIYDIAGNVWEFTVESDISSCRTVRGAGYNMSSSSFYRFISNRNSPKATSASNTMGSRSMLVI